MSHYDQPRPVSAPPQGYRNDANLPPNHMGQGFAQPCSQHDDPAQGCHTPYAQQPPKQQNSAPSIMEECFHLEIEGTKPIEPWCIGGPVIKGFGRGSKVLGIPTANLSTESFSDILSEHASGVYFGWASLLGRGIYKMVMNIGWNPYFGNTKKTIEPWLLHEFNEDFYGEELRLVIVGYIGPEANFPSLERLISKIHEDGRIAEKVLDLPLYAAYKDLSYLTNPLVENNTSSSGSTFSSCD